ncbi:RNA-guided endonuclease InsQ/TnpB family protein [Ktedonobacter racemifer]|uniref:Transposase, IS605 OrfB family n=1 Tax=Ktedonobacter racemifer DSM 44963 TaxID=485913 RepID=D6TL70_KTERA|nr:RNA-guided endonuclease TnpB family protein [Ktedonobacter racemifer]EFH85255.1 transposase, IS605 OrfB family [Ktedonobacter racemifer DSM 44963]EFH86520.1 transposase, IS605 OrfB family [Ktedonobacter racemifer DSM 44963]
MKQTIIAKLKLHTTSEQLAQLRNLQLAYRDALNYVSRYAFEHGKMSSKRRLQEGTYQELRVLYALPAQMACSVPRQVGATYKGLWTKYKKHAASRKAGVTKKRYKGLDQPPRYLSPTVTYQQGRDYGFKTEQRVSVLTLSGRLILPYSGYERHVALIEQGTSIGTAQLWYDQRKKRFYLLVALSLELPDPEPGDLPQVVGVDVGRRYLAVTSTTTGSGDPLFFLGKEAVAQADHYTRLRKRLQQKGTRGAMRKVRAIEQRERRLKAETNHCISKRIIHRHPASLIGLEELTDIRERTKPKKHRRTKQGKSSELVSPKQRRENRRRSQWSFAQLQAMIAYKAMLAGSVAIKVDADYSSQACPKCGHTARANRPGKGLVFVCQNCHYTLHADLVGARNLVLRTLLVWQDWARTGLLSVAPDTSDSEAKAARLSRYAELRWSPDASPSLQRWGH